MRVVQGKWVDEFGNGINKEVLNGHDFISFRDKLTCIFGENVTYDKIDILHHVLKMDDVEHRALSGVLNNGLLRRFRL
jgi:hypothetical protein